MSSTFSATPSALAGSDRTTAHRGTATPSREAAWLWLAVLVFIAVTFWWLTQDDRIPDFDSGLHMSIANADHVAIATGHFSDPFTGYNTYPPLVHLVGAVTILLLGFHPMALTLASNVVFVPLLAFGCYGTGTIVAGRRAGLLAGLFALGTPMIASMMHNFDLDPPEAAMVATSVWLVLASRRFERLGIAVLAGVACGLALLTKETATVFLAGLLVMVVIRGGWRHPRGLLGFALAFAVVAGPWYVYHFSDLTSTFSSIGQLNVSPIQSPARGSLRNWTWYVWNLLNEQILLPFAILFAIGICVAAVKVVRSRFSRDNVLPELLAGGLVGYVAMSYLTHKDPRYTLPILVYVAVLGTFWIPLIRWRVPRLGVTMIAVALAIGNFAGMVFGIGGTQRIMIPLYSPDNSLIFARQLTVYENWGWLRGAPGRDGDVLALLQGLHRQGIQAIGLDPSASELDFSFNGIIPEANTVGLGVVLSPVGSPTLAYLFLHHPSGSGPKPCQVLNDGMGAYAISGPLTGFSAASIDNPARPRQRFRFICPGRAPVMWPVAPAG